MKLTFKPLSMVEYMCTDHRQDFWGMDQAIEHVRRRHSNFIDRAGRLGARDTHGHIWYCHQCQSRNKPHRSFDSDDAMWRHLKARHSFIMESLIEL
ncbi:hypothetical protein BJX63DRAFT_207251 [Aspergillus granulosus]|uniref:BED-type domain-containing protein n=1 Tax=Aspergillus granulosus TaxID=176169 RepID=A0ABR4HGX1_9EURO